MVRDGCKCYFSFWAMFCPFTPLTARKNEIFKKMEKSLEMPSFYTCTKNYDHMVYCFWDMARDRHNCDFSFWAIFCSFTLNSPKNQNFKKNERSLEISTFYTSVPKITIWWCTVPETWCRTDGQTDRKSDT